MAKDDEEKRRQAVAAAAAQQAARAAAQPPTAPTTTSQAAQPGIPGPPAATAVSPLGVPAPIPVSTPYGTIATTNPQGQAKLEQMRAPNALMREGVFDPVQQSAQNYRDLISTNAPLDQRAFAKQEYANALNDRGLALRTERATQDYGNVMAGRADRYAASVAQNLPLEQRGQAMVEARERYRNLPPEQQGVEYYNRYLVDRKGISPYNIGGAQLTQRQGGGHGLAVLSPEQETAARSSVEEAAKRSREMMNAERTLRRSKTPEGILAAQEQRQKRIQHDIQSGLKNPYNPTAGMDRTNAMRVAGAELLAKDSSTLAGLADKAKEAVKEVKSEERPVEEARERLDLLSRMSQEEQRRWAEELQRRRAEIMGRYAYNS